MKQSFIHTGIFLLLGMGILPACKKDNYQAPNATLQGNITDKTTGTAVPLQTFNGAVIRYYQQEYSSSNPNPTNSAVHPDGSYENAMLFTGKYKLIAEGPFYYTDTITVNVNGTTRQDIPVKPFLLVTAATSEVTANTVTIRYSVKRNGNTQKIARVSAVIGTTEGVDVNSNTFTATQDVQNIPDATIETTTFEKKFTGLKANTVYYLRAAARTGGAENPSQYFNYTPLIRIQTTN